jgi:UMF1 family MFS transporter
MMLVDLDRGRTEGIALAKTLDDLDARQRNSIGARHDLEDDLN